MKHLRVEDVTFADMVPLLWNEDLLPEHGDHIGKPQRGQGRRTDARQAQTCGHCEHLIHEQWRRNVRNLSADEAEMLDARFLWRNYATKMIAQCLADYRQKIIITTTKRRRIEPKEGQTQAVDFAVETTTREETRIYPQLLEMARDLRADIARLAGVPVGDLSSVPRPSETAKDRKKLHVYRRDAEPDTEQPAN